MASGRSLKKQASEHANHPLVESFPPLSDGSAKILILGSMPGQASLRAQQYYAHPQNLFWRIMAELLNFSSESCYAERIAWLTHSGIAVWDVLARCARPGSLDSSIIAASVEPNDIAAFIGQHPRIRRVAFNGAEAEKLFRRHVQPHFAPCWPIDFVRLPSTSPANASISFEVKRKAWSEGLLVHPRETL